MKRSFLFLLLLVAALIAVNYWRDHWHDDDSYLQTLEHTLQCADWLTYQDPDLGYAMRYPSCFVPAEAEGDSSVRFAYVEQLPLHNIVYITLEARTEVCRDSLNPYREMRLLAKDMGGICLCKSPTEYLLTARLQSRSTHVTAYHLQAKYVLRQRLWFVETLIYPEDFAPSMHRLIDEVNAWKPYP